LFTWGNSGVTRQEREAAAAATLRDCRAALAARGRTILREVTGTDGGDGSDGGLIDWRHYPEGEVYDAATHAQYFYHRHPVAVPLGASSTDEHGHFHLFLRGEGVPSGIMPLVLPDQAVANAAVSPNRRSAPLKRGSRDEVCHLVAIAVDARGEPVRLITTNRWVTGETWYQAADVIRLLGRFRPSGEGSWGLLNRWLGALVALYEPEIAALLRRRDKTIIDRRWRWRTNVLEDPRLEITSSLDIDLDARLAAVDAAASERVSPPPTRRRIALPPMEEGWGA
jgi:uncharacterized protein DUF6969